MVRVFTFLTAILLAAAACVPTPGPPQAAPDQPVAGGRIVDASISDIKTLNPVLSSDTASSGVWGLVYYSLTRANPDTGDIEGSLAEKFELNPDGLALKYTIRDNVVWSDGTPFTGEDYKYTAEAVMRSKKTIRKGAFENVRGAKEYADGKADSISGIQVGEGGRTVTISFTKVFCPAIVQLGGAGAGGLIPKHHFVKHWDNKTTDTSKNIDDNPLNLAPPAATGPFVFKEWRPGDQVTLVRNDRFFRGPALIEEYVVKVYADQTAVKAALMTGEVAFSGIDPKDHEELSRLDHLKPFRFAGSGYNYIGWNPNTDKAPWLAKKEVRHALWHGLNIDLIMEKVVFGFGKRVYAHTPPSSWAYDDSALNKYPFDQARAKRLLEQAGAKPGPDGILRWTDGKPMRMKIETNAGNLVRETILQIAQEQYGQIGVRIDPLLESFPALTERTRFGKPDWEGFILGFALGLDPDPHGIWHSVQAHATGLNRVGWKRTDKLIEQQRDGPDCGRESRKKILSEFNKVLNEEAPFTFLYSGDVIGFSNKALRNFDPKPFSTGSLWNIEKWWLRR